VEKKRMEVFVALKGYRAYLLTPRWAFIAKFVVILGTFLVG